MTQGTEKRQVRPATGDSGKSGLVWILGQNPGFGVYLFDKSIGG